MLEVVATNCRGAASTAIRLRRAFALVSASAVVIAVAASAPAAQAALSSAPVKTDVTDGTVYGIAVGSNAVYLGGDFTQVGPRSGPGAAISRSTSQFDPDMPQVSGGGGAARVTAVAPDGSGGWYVGGDFSHVGGVPRLNLAHILADHTVDPNWTPEPNDRVDALAVAPDGAIYAGGRFDLIGANHVRRDFVAAIDPRTGDATPWAPEPGPHEGPEALNTEVWAVTVGPGGRIYLGGNFTSVDDQPRKRIAAVDPQTGHPTAWNPGADAAVEGFAFGEGVAYVRGAFSTIGANNAARNKLAALDLSSGNATAWNPNPTSTGNCNAVFTLARAPDGTIYAGGCFSTIGANSASRANLAALDPNTGNAIGWNPGTSGGVRWSPDGFVNSLAVGTDGTIYAGGNFTTAGANNAPRGYLAAFDPGTGNATSWNPNANSAVLTVALGPGNTIYAGGIFTSLGGKPRHDLAALDAATGALLPWNPRADHPVHALAIGGDGTVYAGGQFQTIGANGASRSSIAALDPTTGNASSWDPNADYMLYTLSVSANGTVYAAGGFTRIGANRALRAGVAALDPLTGNATSWNPDPHTTDGLPSVSGLALAKTNPNIYVGGAFNTIGANLPQVRNYVAALNSTTANASNWDPNARNSTWAGGPAVNSIALAPDERTIYVSGGFGTIGANSATRNNLAALDATSGNATSWDPHPTGVVGPLLSSLAVGADGTVYAGGDFTGIGSNGARRGGLAALDPVTGNATAFDPDPRGGVLDQATGPTGTLYAAGAFWTTELAPQEGIAAFGPAPPPPTNSAQPAIAGEPGVGKTLSCQRGGWGGSVVYFDYVWLRDGAPIEDSARTFYDVSATDAGHQLACRVTAHNDGGSATATSSTVAVPADPGPTPGGSGGGGGDVPGAPSPGGGTGANGTGTSSSRPPGSSEPGVPLVAPSVHAPRARVSVPSLVSRAALIRRGISVRVRCSARCFIDARLISTRPAEKVLGHARSQVMGDATAVLRLRVSRSGTRVLGVSPPRALTVKVVVTDEAGRSTTTARSIRVSG
jgi:hypothetical protein